jgi:hypothetical protein
MAKAKSIHMGDWIKVGGKKVKVTGAQTREGRRRIYYKSGRTFGGGMLDRDPNADVKRVYGTGWSW